MNNFTNGQIVELRKLEEAYTKSGSPGFRAKVQELIDRLKAGVDPPDTPAPFLVQSRALWNYGWGWRVDFKKLDEYRKSLEQEGLPVTPERPAGMPDHLNRLVLWDQRPFLVKKKGKQRVFLEKACRLLRVKLVGGEDNIRQHEATPQVTALVRWVWCQDGRRNQNRRPSDCRQSFVPPEVGLEAIGGLFLVAQDPTVIRGHSMYLPGSARRDYPSVCLDLVWVAGSGPCLFLGMGDIAYSECGSASRWE